MTHKKEVMILVGFLLLMIIGLPLIFGQQLQIKILNTTSLANSSYVSYGVNGYDYHSNSSNTFDFMIKAHSSYGDGTQYCYNESGKTYCLIYQSSDMSYRDYVGSQDYISSITDSVGIINGNLIKYPNVFTNTNLSFAITGNTVKENYIIGSVPRAPASYLGANVSLDFGGYIKFGNLSLYSNGVNYGNASFTTNSEIDFISPSGKILFYLPTPYAIDSAGNKTNIQYEVKNQGSQIYFYTRTPFKWLNASRTFPVYVDPTITSQSSSQVEYIDDFNPGLITDFVLQKYNGTAYNIEPNTIWIANQTQCLAMGKNGLCFGANDTTLNSTQIANYSYVISSTYPVAAISDTSTSYPSPIFYTKYYSKTNLAIQTQYYYFSDICNNSYANCQWSNDGNTAIITFNSKQYIDPTVTITASSIFSTDSILTNVSTEGNLGSHLTVDITQIPTNSLVAYYPMDVQNTTANLTYDFSVYGNDATMKNNPVFVANCLYGSCYNFTSGSSQSLNVTITQSKTSITMWVKNATDTGWTFLARNGTALFNNNGVAGLAGRPFPFNNNVSNNVRIGVNFTGTNLFYTGLIDEVMVFSTGLSQAQIQAIYNNQTARFYAGGQQTVKQINVTSGDSVNVSALFNAYFNTNISVRVGAWDVSLGYNNSDINSTLNSLISYYHFDENSYNGTTGEIVDAMGRNNATAIGGASNTMSGYFDNALSVNGNGTNYGNATVTQGTITSIALWQRNSTSSAWTFVVYNGAFYTNSVAGLTAQFPVNVSGTNVKFGVNFTGGANQYFNGSIDEVMIFNRTLTTAEIKQLYVQGMPLWNFTSYQNMTTSGNFFNISYLTTNILPDFLFLAYNTTNPFYTPNLGLNSGISITTKDNINPRVNLTYPLNTTYNINVSSINYTSFDTNPGNCWWNNGTTNSTPPGVFGANFTGLTSKEGSNTWTVFCNDTSNNLNSSSVTFFKDTIYPNVNFTNPTPLNNTFANTNSLYVNVSLYDLNFVNVTFYLYNTTSLVKNVTYTSYTGNSSFNNFTLSYDSTYYYNVSVTDVANNINTTETRVFTRTSQTPQISYAGGTAANYANLSQSNVYINTTINITNFANITFSLFNSTFSNVTTYNTQISFINFTNIADGRYWYYVNITDLALNKNSTAIYNITLDTKNPNATLIYPLNGTYNSTTTQNFTVNITDNLGIQNATLNIYNATSGLLINQTNVSYAPNVLTSTLGIAVTLVDGVYNWFYKIFDWAGNSFTTTNSTITIDTVKPNVNITYPLNNAGIYAVNVSTINYTASDINGNRCWYSKNGGATNSTPSVPFGTNFTGVISVEGINTWTVYCNDSANNLNSSTVTFNKDTTPPTIIVIEPGTTVTSEAVGENIVMGLNVTDINNVSYVSAVVTKPDSTTVNVSMMGGQILSDNFLNGNQWFNENNSLNQSSQTCTGIFTGGKAITYLSGNGDPQTDTFCSEIGNNPLFGDFNITIKYNLTSLGSDSAANFQVVSEQPSSSNAVVYGYIGRTNFAGEGNGYQVYAQDDIGNSLSNKISTSDTYGAFKIQRQGTLFTFYYQNNTDLTWISLASGTLNMHTGIWPLFESESAANNWGTANVTWTNFTSTPLPSNQYIGTYVNTTLTGTYLVTFFANNTLNNINNYTQSSFKINQTNYPPSPPFILYPTIGSLNNKNITIKWSNVNDINNDTIVFNITLLNADGSFNKTIVDNYGNINTNSYVWDTTTVPDAQYSLTIQARETLTAEKYTSEDTLAGNFTVDNTPPNCTIISTTPTGVNSINSSSTGLFNVLINCTDKNGINTQQITNQYQGAFITRTVDSFQLAPGIPNYWSVRYPNNSLGVTGTLTPPYQIWRAEGRNRGMWFENLTSLASCQGLSPCYQPMNDTFSYAIEDGYYNQLQITNTSSTSALFNYTWQIPLAAFRQSMYLSWSSIIAEPKKNFTIYNNNYLLLKRFDAEAYRGTPNYTVNGFVDVGGLGSLATMKAYFCNSSYDPTGSTKVINSPDCGFFGSFLTSDFNNPNNQIVQANSTYSEFSFEVTNGNFVGVKATAESYIEVETLESSSALGYNIRYVNGTNPTNVAFNDTKVTWTTTDGGTTWTQAPFTVDFFTENVRSANDEFQFGVYATDNAGNTFFNPKISYWDIAPTNHPISSPAILEYNSSINPYNLNLNGTYSNLMNVLIGVSSDPDGPGTVQHNLTLLNIDGTYNATINGSFYSPTDTNIWILFNTNNVADGNYRMNIKATANDNPADTQNRTTSQNFTVFNHILNLSFVPPTSPQIYPAQVNASCTAYQNLPTLLYRNGVDVTATENGKNITLGAGSWNYSCRFAGNINYSAQSINVTYVINPLSTTTTVTTFPPSPITYPTASNFSCTNNFNLTTSMFVNGVDQTAQKGLNVTRPAGAYIINCSYAATQNYSASSQQVTYIVSGGTSSIDFVYTPTMNAFQNYSTPTITSFCYDTNFQFCTSDIACTLTTYYQNFSLMINQSLMTRTFNSYYYTLSPSQTSITGNYNGLIRCSQANVDKTSSFTYVISSTGLNINDQVDTVPSNTWNYVSRNLTYTAPAVAYVNTTDISIAVWNYTNRSLTYYADAMNYTLAANSVWGYSGPISNNILSQIAYAIWNYVGSIVIIQNQIADGVWHYNSRYTHGEILD